MKKYLLDTNVISETRKPKPHGGVLAWLAGLRDEQIFLSAVTLGELQRGIERTRLQDPKKAGEIELWLDKVVESFQILPMDSSCFRQWAVLMESNQQHLLEDAMIAATARVNGLTVATRNESDFVSFAVDIFNPFESTR